MNPAVWLVLQFWGFDRPSKEGSVHSVTVKYDNMTSFMLLLRTFYTFLAICMLFLLNPDMTDMQEKNNNSQKQHAISHKSSLSMFSPDCRLLPFTSSNIVFSIPTDNIKLHMKVKHSYVSLDFFQYIFRRLLLFI